MIKIAVLVYLCTFICLVLSSPEQIKHNIVKPCHIGDVIRNECNDCLCTSRGIFECIVKPCDKTKGLSEIAEAQEACSPSQMYVQNMITCICTSDGIWPHKSCYKSFQALPSRNIETHKCEPNTYVMIDCNVCRCDSDGEFIKNRCTKNICEKNAIHNTRRNDVDTVKNSVYSKCEIKNWYSLAPCQFCYCVNENKLVCNTGNHYNKNIEVGNYDLQMCGKELILEALELVPDKDKSWRAITNPYLSSKEESTTTETILKADDAAKSDDEVNKNSREDTTTPIINDPGEESNHDYNDEYISDSDETTTNFPTTISYFSAKPTENKELDTLSKSDKDDDISSEDDSSKEYSNEIAVDVEPLYKPEKINSTTTLPNNIIKRRKVARSGNWKSDDQEYSGNTLNINIPKMLNKVFKMAMRKSMVSLSTPLKCVPGDTSTKHCNVCFCLKNGKLLCTTNKCN